MGNANSGGHAINLVGRRYGRLLVISRDGYHVYPNGKNTITWSCLCDCGNKLSVYGDSLRKGNTQSCGCLKHEADHTRLLKHGHSSGDSRERLYAIWLSMRSRVFNPNNKNFSRYGGRGICVCAEWDDYIMFRNWALANGYDENAPVGKCTIDRIDNNGNYEPCNCRWVDMKVQNNNKEVCK